MSSSLHHFLFELITTAIMPEIMIKSTTCPIEATQPSTKIENEQKINLSKIRPWIYKPKKKVFTLENINKSNSRFKVRRWSISENQKYMIFLKRYAELVQGNKFQKRKYHMNRMMSKCIGTRSPEQCRSHHQKMVQYYDTIEGIIKHLQEAMGQTVLPEKDIFQVQDNGVSSYQGILNDILINNITQPDDGRLAVEHIEKEESSLWNIMQICEKKFIDEFSIDYYSLSQGY